MLTSPFPNAVLSNLFYPYTYIQTNIMLGRVIKPVETILIKQQLLGDLHVQRVPGFLENVSFLKGSLRWYRFWDGFLPTVLTHFYCLSAYSVASVCLFNRKWFKKEHFKLTESTRRCFEECVLYVIASVASHPIRVISLRSMAQLSSHNLSIYK